MSFLKLFNPKHLEMILRTLTMKILQNILTRITGINDKHPLYYIIYCVTQIKEDPTKSSVYLSKLNTHSNNSKDALISSSKSECQPDNKIFIDYHNLISNHSDHSFTSSDFNSSNDDTEYQASYNNDTNLTNDDDHLSGGSSSICIIASDSDFCENDNISFCSFVVFDAPNQYSYEEEIVCSYFICSNRPSGEDILQLIDSSGTLIKSIELEKEKIKEYENFSNKLITNKDPKESTIHEKCQHLSTITDNERQKIKEFYKEKLEYKEIKSKDNQYKEDIYEEDFVTINMKDLIICNNHIHLDVGKLDCSFNKTKNDISTNTQLYNLSDKYISDEINYNKENANKRQCNKSSSSYYRSGHGECNYIHKNIKVRLDNRPDDQCIWIYKRNNNILAISEPFIITNNSQKAPCCNEKITKISENYNSSMDKLSKNYIKIDSILDETVPSNYDYEEVKKVKCALPGVSKTLRNILEILGKNDHLLKEDIKIIKEEINNIYFYLLYQNSLLNKIKYHYDDANNIIKLQTKQIHILKTLLDTFTITENVTNSIKNSALE